MNKNLIRLNMSYCPHKDAVIAPSGAQFKLLQRPYVSDDGETYQSTIDVNDEIINVYWDVTIYDGDDPCDWGYCYMLHDHNGYPLTSL